MFETNKQRRLTVRFWQEIYDLDNILREIHEKLGLADVKAFGLEYQDCEAVMQKLGHTLEVKALSVA